MKFIDLFAGVGGFRLGMERAGHECVWSCEVDRWCQIVYRYHWKEVEAGDVRQVDTSRIPDFDLLCAGFPCQAFSVAGKRRGFNDTRGTLFFEIARILKDKRPRHFLLENVKGLLSHDDGKTFNTILGVLADLGYDCQWQVLNSKDFGVPQNRERIFVVGHPRGQPRPEVFPIGEANGMAEAEVGGQGLQDETGTIHARYGAGWRKHAQETYIAEGEPMILQVKRHHADGNHLLRHYEGKVPALTQQMGTGGGNVPMVVADRTRTYAGTGRSLESPKPTTNALSSVQKDNLVVMPAPIYKRVPLRYLNRNQRNVEGDYSFAVDASQTSGVAILHQNKSKDVGVHPEGSCALRSGASHNYMTLTDGIRIRRLTPRECERLQGFPDDWTRWGMDEKGNEIEISDTQRYKMMGNAVTVNVIEFLAKRLKGTNP